MNQITGWFVNMPIDSKKLKLTLRWAVINDYWLEISTKPSESPILTFHLGFTDFYPTNTDESTPTNALMLQTQSVIGSYSMMISTTNHFDILELTQALIQGKERWKQLMEKGIENTTLELSFKDKKNSFLVAKNVDCSISPQGFKAQKSPTESTLITFDQIAFARPVCFDSRQGSCFEVSLDGNSQKIEMVYQCHSHDEMKSFMEVFTYLLATNKKQVH